MNENYKGLIEDKQNEILDYLKNVDVFEGQFQYNDFNDQCYKEMYLNNSQDNIKSVSDLKEKIPQLSDTCKKCAQYYPRQRNKSIKGLDVQFGKVLEESLLDFFNNKLKIKAVRADNQNRKYPDCMLLNTDKGILAYFEVKFHGAPFVYANRNINRLCYEGSATLDLDKVTKQIEIIESDLDRPTFYFHWIDYPCLKGIFFETSEQVKEYIYQSGMEFDRKEREGDYNLIHKVGYTKKIYSPLLQMGTFEEFIQIIKDMKKNGVKKY